MENTKKQVLTNQQEKEIKKALLNLYRIKINLENINKQQENTSINNKKQLEIAIKEVSKVDKDICKILEIKFNDKEKKLVLDLIG